MLRVPANNPSAQRTLKPVYAHTQATPTAGFLDSSWDRSFDILPGTVMARKTKERYVPFTGASNQQPYGLSALFVAPSLGIEEVTGDGTNNFTVWVGDAQAQFEVYAPAFDPDGDWTLPTDGRRKMLTGNAHGLLTPTGVNAENVIAELIDVIDAKTILVSLNKYDVSSATVSLAGGS